MIKLIVNISFIAHNNRGNNNINFNNNNINNNFYFVARAIEEIFFIIFHSFGAIEYKIYIFLFVIFARLTIILRRIVLIYDRHVYYCTIISSIEFRLQ